ncbi:probable fatty acyl-CoA reductase 4 [Cryptomeria japonica]|uniref:probable fatty acyl-CoA reductase 4 n=1 Tax=Cryptomeria japonica TaxID=3369 RepID=UPI0027D9E5C9|nr:probable fatty acyl-CoA reductase 4 [Cryptomeria japonica]
MAMDTLEFLRDKNILIVGATGFLGKVFVEKILRVQPDFKCIYTLIRSRNEESARAKLQNEVISRPLFGLLRERYKGERYQEFMARKLVPVVGDVALNDLGIKESIRDELFVRVEILINSAATTNFHERYGISMKVNALRSKNIIDFSYVNVGSMGMVREEVVRMGEMVSYSGGEISISQIESECNLIEQIMKELKNVLVKRVLTYKCECEQGGELWMANAYVFTKAVGELMVDYFREDIPTVIIRPTIIESSLKEPVPGWMEGNRYKSLAKRKQLDVLDRNRSFNFSFLLFFSFHLRN